MNANYTFREIYGLTGFLKVLLGLGILMALVSIFSASMQAELLSRGSFSVTEGQANDFRQSIVSLFQVALYLFTMVIFGCWIVRANKNVNALGAINLPITPGWAVGYFFIPILNLFRPYQAMKNLWQASHNPVSWSTTKAGSILPAWWALWIFCNILGHLSARTMMAAHDIKSLQVATDIDVISLAVYIPFCLVTITLVTQIADSQKTYQRNNDAWLAQTVQGPPGEVP
jgi:hypothetical protein